MKDDKRSPVTPITSVSLPRGERPSPGVVNTIRDARPPRPEVPPVERVAIPEQRPQHPSVTPTNLPGTRRGIPERQRWVPGAVKQDDDYPRWR